MPSPFPGMDPYLEHPDFFPGIHGSFLTYVREQLQNRLPAPYFAEMNERVWVEASDRFIEPDVNVIRGDEESEGGTAVALQVRTPPVTLRVLHDEHREVFVNIMARRDEEQIVTAIELLSLSNKTPGRRGQTLYQLKQAEVMESDINLVEIDLLRGGEHTTALPLDLAIEKVGRFDYHVCVNRFNARHVYDFYPIRMQDRLPEIAVPLLPGDGAVPLDLQAVFDRSYDTGPYRRRVRYAELTPTPPLTPEQTAWAGAILKA